MATLCGMRETMPGISPPNTPTLASGYMNFGGVGRDHEIAGHDAGRCRRRSPSPGSPRSTGLVSLWLT